MDSSSLAPDVVFLTTLLDLVLEEIRKGLIESLMGRVSLVIKRPAPEDPKGTQIFVCFVRNCTSPLTAFNAGVRAMRKRVLQGKLSNKMVVTDFKKESRVGK